MAADDDSLLTLSNNDYGNFIEIDEADHYEHNHSMHACMADMGGDVLAVSEVLLSWIGRLRIHQDGAPDPELQRIADGQLDDLQVDDDDHHPTP